MLTLTSCNCHSIANCHWFLHTSSEHSYFDCRSQHGETVAQHGWSYQTSSTSCVSRSIKTIQVIFPFSLYIHLKWQTYNFANWLKSPIILILVYNARSKESLKTLVICKWLQTVQNNVIVIDKWPIYLTCVSLRVLIYTVPSVFYVWPNSAIRVDAGDR